VARCSRAPASNLRRHCERSDLSAVAQRAKPEAIHLATKRVWIVSPLRSSQKPSYSAKAEYPIHRSFFDPSLTPRNTGSPAGACHRAAIRPTRWRAMTTESVACSYPSNTRSRPRDAMRPRRYLNFPPKEGVGNAGCPLHPRPRVHLVMVERTRVTTSTPESPDVPARNGFNGFLRALPGDRACLPPSPADRSCLSPVGPT